MNAVASSMRALNKHIPSNVAGRGAAPARRAVAVAGVAVLLLGGCSLLPTRVDETAAGSSPAASASDQPDGATLNATDGDPWFVVNTPANATGAELAGYEYLIGIVDAVEIALEWRDLGLDRVADSVLASTYATLAALRFTAQCLSQPDLAVCAVPSMDDGGGDDGGAPPDANDVGLPVGWASIAAISWGSPAPFFFEAVVHESAGRTEAATVAREAASGHSVPIDRMEPFAGVATLSATQVSALYDEAVRLETALRDLFEPIQSPIPVTPHNHDSVWLVEQGIACLESEFPDTVCAELYFEAALAI